MTEIYLHIVVRMVDYMATHRRGSGRHPALRRLLGDRLHQTKGDTEQRARGKRAGTAYRQIKQAAALVRCVRVDAAATHRAIRAQPHLREQIIGHL